MEDFNFYKIHLTDFIFQNIKKKNNYQYELIYFLVII